MIDFQHYLVEEFAEDYADGRLSRREAVKLIASITGSILAADLVLAAWWPPPQGAEGARSLTPPQSSEPGTSPASALTPDDAPIHGERREFVSEPRCLDIWRAHKEREPIR